MDIIPQKICSTCKNPYPATTEYFHRAKVNKDGLCGRCKQCKSSEDKAYASAHQEERKVYFARYNVEQADKIRHNRQIHRTERIEYNREYYRTHKEEISDQRRGYYQEHQEQLRQYSLQFYSTDRGRVIKRVNENKRRARKLQSNGSYTQKELYQQLQRQKYKCYYCACKLGEEYHADHVVPLSRGGSNTIDNIVIACPFCNQSKHDRLPHEWGKGGRLL